MGHYDEQREQHEAAKQSQKHPSGMDFEQLMMQSITQSILRQISAADLVAIPYDGRIKLPADFMRKAWEMVDQNAILEQMKARLESELVDRLINAMAAEIATDIKQILSDKERRESLRSVVRDNLDKLTRV